MERSDYYQKRTSLLKAKGIPKLSDAKVSHKFIILLSLQTSIIHTQTNLGDPLSNVVFKECEEALKEDFGLKVPLKGPGETLWVSPSDLLLGKIALKPPITFKCLQALMHKGILGIFILNFFIIIYYIIFALFYHRDWSRYRRPFQERDGIG